MHVWHRIGTPYSSCTPDTPSSNGSADETSLQAELSLQDSPPSPNLRYHSAPVELPAGGVLAAAGDDVETRSTSITILSRDSIDESASNYSFEPNVNSKGSHPARTLYYPSLDKCTSLEADLQVFHIIPTIIIYITFIY